MSDRVWAAPGGGAGWPVAPTPLWCDRCATHLTPAAPVPWWAGIQRLHPPCPQCLRRLQAELPRHLAIDPVGTTTWLKATWSHWGRHMAPGLQGTIARLVLAQLGTTQQLGVETLQWIWTVTPLAAGCLLDADLDLRPVWDLDEPLLVTLDDWITKLPPWGPAAPAHIEGTGGLCAIDLLRFAIRRVPMGPGAWGDLVQQWSSPGALDCWALVIQREQQRWHGAWSAEARRGLLRAFLMHRHPSVRTFGVRCASEGLLSDTGG